MLYKGITLFRLLFAQEECNSEYDSPSSLWLEWQWLASPHPTIADQSALGQLRSLVVGLRPYNQAEPHGSVRSSSDQVELTDTHVYPETLLQ